MTSIYQNTTSTIVWLGVACNHQYNLDAARLMNNIISRIEQCCDLQGRLQPELYTPAQDALLAPDARIIPPSDPSARDGWEGIPSTFRASFWSRTWIYQEYSASKTILFYSGTRRITKKQLITLYSAIRALSIADWQGSTEFRALGNIVVFGFGSLQDFDVRLRENRLTRPTPGCRHPSRTHSSARISWYTYRDLSSDFYRKCRGR